MKKYKKICYTFNIERRKEMKEKAEKFIALKVTNSFKEQLKKEAGEKGLTLSGYIKFILAERNK